MNSPSCPHSALYSLIELVVFLIERSTITRLPYSKNLYAFGPVFRIDTRTMAGPLDPFRISCSKRFALPVTFARTPKAT